MNSAHVSRLIQQPSVSEPPLHFGVKQHLTTQITAYDRPQSFTDEMIRGVFHRMKHNHEFTPQPSGALMIDLLCLRAPLGVPGRVAESLILTRYMRGLQLTRNSCLTQVAETNVDP
jgi:ligand-binding SRPBCC domain-containing protein